MPATACLLSVRWGLKWEAHVVCSGCFFLVSLEVKIDQALQRKVSEFRITENIDTSVLIGQKESKLM